MDSEDIVRKFHQKRGLDPGSKIRDPEKIHPGSGSRGVKKHRILIRNTGLDLFSNVHIRSQMSGFILKCPYLFPHVGSIPACLDMFPHCWIYSQMSVSVTKCPDPLPNVRFHYHMLGSVNICRDPFPYFRIHPICPDLSQMCLSVPKRDSLTRFSTLGFYHESIPLGSLINGLK
jgi:hypothetical protein